MLCSQAGDGMKQSHGTQQKKTRGQGMLALRLDAAGGKPSVVNCDFALVLSISCLGSFTLNGRL